jgi:hypothetical protein
MAGLRKCYTEITSSQFVARANTGPAMPLRRSDGAKPLTGRRKCVNELNRVPSPQPSTEADDPSLQFAGRPSATDQTATAPLM